jgi:hypothetical protein
MKIFFILGSILMALAVAMGAFGAHGLSGKVTEKMLYNWQTGAHYHIVHALAIIIIALTIAKFHYSRLVDFCRHRLFLWKFVCNGTYKRKSTRSHYSDWWSCLYRWLDCIHSCSSKINPLVFQRTPKLWKSF